MIETTTVGIIGCGNISQAYFKGCQLFPFLKIKACADLKEEVAKEKAQENDCKSMTVDALLNDPDIEIVINLTVPSAHAEVSMMALNAGKHVHLEKPLAVDLIDAKRILDVAQQKSLRVGCAPDTFLGAGQQTARKIVDDGWIGKPLSGSIFMMGRGPESWHPNPAFFYQKGGGPMLDMGPYYMTALINLLGPVKTVIANTTRGYEKRLATCKPFFGTMLDVDVPTHNTGIIIFQSGAVISATISFDVYAHSHAPIELYGTEGSIQVPDPNGFGGDINVFRVPPGEWNRVGFTHRYHENCRGIGVADMAQAIRTERPHRCSGTLAYHALEVMHAFEQSSTKSMPVDIESTCERPHALPTGIAVGMLE